MKERWLQLVSVFESRSQREKVLIAIGCLAVVVLLLQILLLDSVEQTMASNQKQQQDIRLNNQRMSNENALLAKQLAKDPDVKLDQQINQLSAQHHILAQQLAYSVEGMVSPKKMSHLLQRVLKNTPNLTLIKMTSLPSRRLGKSSASAKDDYSHYYIHPIRMELSGEYFTIRNYLKSLENLSVHYYWHRLSYKVTQYPKARVSVEVYTIGTQKEFIRG
ncbi:MAG: MSHA biogenesis protein MshJ [Vibrio sp.]